jgi:hypothetical protein
MTAKDLKAFLENINDNANIKIYIRENENLKELEVTSIATNFDNIEIIVE